MSVESIIKNICTFLEILQNARSSDVNWNEQSLDHAIKWASFCQKIYDKAEGKEYFNKLNDEVKKLNTLPWQLSNLQIDIYLLKNSLSLLCQALLENEFVITHNENLLFMLIDRIPSSLLSQVMSNHLSLVNLYNNLLDIDIECSIISTKDIDTLKRIPDIPSKNINNSFNKININLNSNCNNIVFKDAICKDIVSNKANKCININQNENNNKNINENFKIVINKKKLCDNKINTTYSESANLISSSYYSNKKYDNFINSQILNLSNNTIFNEIKTFPNVIFKENSKWKENNRNDLEIPIKSEADTFKSFEPYNSNNIMYKNYKLNEFTNYDNSTLKNKFSNFNSPLNDIRKSEKRFEDTDLNIIDVTGNLGNSLIENDNIEKDNVLYLDNLQNKNNEIDKESDDLNLLKMLNKNENLNNKNHQSFDKLNNSKILILTSAFLLLDYIRTKCKVMFFQTNQFDHRSMFNHKLQIYLQTEAGLTHLIFAMIIWNKIKSGQSIFYEKKEVENSFQFYEANRSNSLFYNNRSVQNISEDFNSRLTSLLYDMFNVSLELHQWKIWKIIDENCSFKNIIDNHDPNDFCTMEIFQFITGLLDIYLNYLIELGGLFEESYGDVNSITDFDQIFTWKNESRIFSTISHNKKASDPYKEEMTYTKLVHIFRRILSSQANILKSCFKNQVLETILSLAKASEVNLWSSILQQCSYLI